MFSSLSTATAGEDERVWIGIRESTRPRDFETFIATYPRSPFVPFARNRMWTLRRDRPETREPPEAHKPIVAVTPMERILVVRRDTVLLESPARAASAVAELPARARIAVTGRAFVEGERWYQVPTAPEGVGYVQAQHLRPPAPLAKAQAKAHSKAERKPKKPPAAITDVRRRDAERVYRWFYRQVLRYMREGRE